MRNAKITINAPDLEIGRKCLKVGNITYNVGDILKRMRFYMEESTESGSWYVETDVKLTSTNVRKQTASFRGVGRMVIKRVGE